MVVVERLKKIDLFSAMEAVITDVINIIEEGRRKAYQAINSSMVEAYWLAGKRIVEDELEGQDRAEYGN